MFLLVISLGIESMDELLLQNSTSAQVTAPVASATEEETAKNKSFDVRQGQIIELD